MYLENMLTRSSKESGYFSHNAIILITIRTVLQKTII